MISQRIRFHSMVDVPRAFAWTSYLRPGMFERLTPPWQDVSTTRIDGTVLPGDRREIEVNLGPFSLTWIAVHEEFHEGRLFTDRQLDGPFRYWRHQHHFVDRGNQRCVISDHIDFTLPFPQLTHRFSLKMVRSELLRMFKYRHFTTFHDFREHYHLRTYPRRSVRLFGEPATLVDVLGAYLQIGGHDVHGERDSSDCSAGTEISLRKGAHGGVAATIESNDGSACRTVTVESAPLVEHDLPLSQLIWLARLFDVSGDLFANEQFAWTTVDDFVSAVHRMLLLPGVDGHWFVRHPNPLAMSDFGSLPGRERSRPGRCAPPDDLVKRISSKLELFQTPGSLHNDEKVISASRFRSIDDAVVMMNGRY